MLKLSIRPKEEVVNTRYLLFSLSFSLSLLLSVCMPLVVAQPYMLESVVHGAVCIFGRGRHMDGAFSSIGRKFELVGSCNKVANALLYSLNSLNCGIIYVD